MKPFTTSLWFDGNAGEAAQFYCSVFKDSKLGKVTPYPEGPKGEAGEPMTVEFELNGQKFVGINGGPQFTFDEAISFQIHCADQTEADHYWATLTEGGEEGPCGWLKDRFGLSWQVVPDGLMELLSDPDSAKAARASAAMMEMTKIDIAKIRTAAAG